jgi:DivIVA domain-containing protein
MIDLTPLDVRKKKGDFRRVMRGYDMEAVDNFLEVAASRMEELVRKNATLSGRVDSMSEVIAEYRERERAMNEALVSAQQLREDVREQARREAEMVLREARAQGDRIVGDASARSRWRWRRCAASRGSVCASCASSARWWSASSARSSRRRSAPPPSPAWRRRSREGETHGEAPPRERRGS